LEEKVRDLRNPFSPRKRVSGENYETFCKHRGQIDNEIANREIWGYDTLQSAGIVDEDEQLVARTQHGDESAFGILVQKHQLRIARLAQRILPYERDIEDVTQEIFLRAYRGLNRFRGESTFGTWLTRICINYCAKYRRRWLPEQVSLEESNLAESLSNPKIIQPDIQIEQEERDQQIQKAILSLPSKYRTVVILRYFEDYSYEQIAQILGCSPSTVRTRLFRAHARLAQKLKQYFQILLP
jgi:RNA polymerase sigma-70 factor (ECF subfamily)